MLAARVNEEPSPLPPDVDVPEEVRQINRRCLAREAGDRPSAAEVAAVLGDASRTRDTTQRGDPPAGGPGRRVRSLVVVAAAAALAGGSLAVLTLSADRGGPDVAAAQPAVTSAGAGGAPTTRAVPSPTGGVLPTPGGPEARPAEEEGTTVPIGGTPPPRRTPARPTPPTSAPASGTDVTALGGVVRVACDGRKASVLSVVPNAGYVIKDLDGGPSDEVQVVLRSTENESEIKVRCEHGQPAPKIKESPQK
jgi:serine/threonine-protein kinase